MQNVGEIEHASENESDTEKPGILSITVITAQGDFEMDNNHEVIALKTVENDKKACKNICGVIE